MRLKSSTCATGRGATQSFSLFPFAALMNILLLAQLLLLREAVDAASERWQREQTERRRREAEECARQEAIEAEKARLAKPRPAENPPPVFSFFWWELASGASVHINGHSSLSGT